VVGTVFRVEVRASGTTVSVSEGTVRVVPHDGSEPRLVRAGERTVVTSAPAERAAVEEDRAPEGASGEPEAGGAPEVDGSARAAAEAAPDEAAPDEDASAAEASAEPSVVDPAARLEHARRLGRTAA